MFFKDLLGRANLINIGSFIISGSECCIDEPELTYTERIREAEQKTGQFLDANFPELNKNNEVSMRFYELADVYRDVYFEIGMIAGAKIALQLNKKLEDLR